jgi:regulator of RNase E activity RraA
MSNTPFSAADLEVLTTWDTPTICNALEIVVPTRRGFGFTTSPLVCARPSLKPIIGYARTATIRAAAPSTMPAADARAHRTAYYEYIANAPGPTICVIEDLDPHPGVGAFWGEVNTAIHKGLGCLGVITSGSIRDLDDCAPGFQLLAGMVGPSHAHVHPVDIGPQVTVHGMQVSSNDIVHADQHGAVVIPATAVTALPAAIDLIARREAVILEAARQPDFDINILKQAMADSAEIH